MIMGPHEKDVTDKSIGGMKAELDFIKLVLLDDLKEYQRALSIRGESVTGK